jgi:LPS O-antigen subunit length determinant protein (WzzB/FepE family)
MVGGNAIVNNHALVVVLFGSAMIVLQCVFIVLAVARARYAKEPKTWTSDVVLLLSGQVIILSLGLILEATRVCK